MSDDDWFERAFEDADGDESDDDPSPLGSDDSPFEDAGGGEESPFEDTGDADDSPFGADAESVDDAGDVPSGSSDSPFDGGDFGDDGSPFSDDAGVESDDDSPFSGDEGGGDDGDSLFEDDFSAAMDSVGGGGFGGGEEDFDEEDFDSEIPRIDIGIEGLDDMIQGGIPQRHLIVAIGGPGTGKTTFGLQFLYHGLRKEDTDRAVFITLEQTYEDIMATANERDWDFDHYEDRNDLAVIDLDPVEMANSLDNIRGELPRLVEDFGADRFVLDSVSLLEMMYDEQSRRRTEVFDFTQSLKDAGVTTLFTSEASEDNPYASRHGIIEYLTDAVFVLQYVRGDTTETRTAVEIQKIRNANHSRQTKPYEITLDGIDVYQQADIF
jgi:KaiC domain protein